MDCRAKQRPHRLPSGLPIGYAGEIVYEQFPPIFGMKHVIWILLNPWKAVLSGVLLIAVSVSVAGCASRTVSAEERALSLRPLYAIETATAEAMAELESALPPSSRLGGLQSRNGLVFRRVTIEGRHCLLVVSGVSVVNAAMTTQMALDRQPITHVIFVGAAGGVNPSREPGDVVIPQTWACHNEAAYVNPRAAGLGWEVPPGGGSGLPNFGMVFPETPTATRLGMSGPQPVPAFEADRGMVAAATKVAGELESGNSGGRRPWVVTSGTGVSGPAFVANREYRAWLYEAWRAEVVDLESAAVAQVCWANGIPFVSVQGVVGLAGGGPSRPPSGTALESPVASASKVVMAMLRQLPE